MTAFQGAGQLVIVALNTSNLHQETQFKIEVSPKVQSFSAIMTNEEASWKEFTPVVSVDPNLSMLLPANSMTTFIGNLSPTSALEFSVISTEEAG